MYRVTNCQTVLGQIQSIKKRTAKFKLFPSKKIKIKIDIKVGRGWNEEGEERKMKKIIFPAIFDIKQRTEWTQNH